MSDEEAFGYHLNFPADLLRLFSNRITSSETLSLNAILMQKSSSDFVVVVVAYSRF